MAIQQILCGFQNLLRVQKFKIKAITRNKRHGIYSTFLKFLKILKLNSKNFKETLNIAIEAIQKGKIVICPTDTVYGLITDASNKKAVEKIFKIKKRPRQKPLPVFVRDLKMAKELAKIDEKQKKLLKRYWPGKYTFILERKHGTKLYGVAKDTIALRIPKYKFLNDLLKKINKPLAQTSANISGKPASTKIEEALKQFQFEKPVLVISDRLLRGQVDFIIDAGDLPKRKPSIIIDLLKAKIKVLRK